MKYIVIEAPLLTDEAAANLQDFFYAITEAFADHYHPQTERFYFESVAGAMLDGTISPEDDPPF